MLDHECMHSNSGGHEQHWYRASIGVTRLPSTPNAKLAKHKGMHAVVGTRLGSTARIGQRGEPHQWQAG